MKFAPVILIYGSFILLLTACNFPTTGKVGATPNSTQAYQTISAEIRKLQTENPAALTSITPQPAETLIPATQVFPTLPTNSGNPTQSIIPTQACDKVIAGNPIDVTIPDDTAIPSGAGFTKTWRLQNAGTCAWNTNYAIVWVSGEPLTAQKSLLIPRSVAPGQSIDISIEMTAPNTQGTYQSNWMIQNDSGSFFGIGPGGKSPFWVRILVPADATTTPQASPSQPANRVIYSGIVQLTNGESIQFVNGSTGSGAGFDMTFTGEGIQTNSPAGLSAAITSLPDYTTCNARAFSSSLIPITADNLYQYYCVQSISADIGYIRILSFESGKRITFDLLVWDAN